MKFKESKTCRLPMITKIVKNKSINLRKKKRIKSISDEKIFLKRHTSHSLTEDKKENEPISESLNQGLLKSPEEFYLKKAKNFYSSYSKLYEINQISINLASPERIKYWAEKILPNQKIIGRVTNANTLHYKSFKPQKGGLFCERIFGPLKDFECACGKRQKKSDQKLGSQNIGHIFTSESTEIHNKETFSSLIDNVSQTPKENEKIGERNFHELEKNQSESFSETLFSKTNEKYNELNPSEERKFCPDCDVEYTWSVIRRYQLGYIQLVAPVTHLWYLKGTPSYLSLLLNMKKKDLEAVIYCSESMTLEASWNHKSLFSESPSNLFSSWQKLIQNQEKETSFAKKTLVGDSNLSILTPLLNSVNSQQKTNFDKIENVISNKEIQTFKTNLNSFKESRVISEKKPVRKNLIPQRLKNWRSLTNKPSLAVSFKPNSLSVLDNSMKIFKTSNTKMTNEFLPDLIPQQVLSLTKKVKTNHILKTIFFPVLNIKNVPTPFYILSKLEYLSQNKVLSIFLQQIWKNFYKKSYIIAYKKAIQILKKTSLLHSKAFKLKKQIRIDRKNFLGHKKNKQKIFCLQRKNFIKKNLERIQLKIKSNPIQLNRKKFEEESFSSFLQKIKYYFKKSILAFLFNLKKLPKFKYISVKNLNTKKIAILKAHNLSQKMLKNSKYFIKLLSNEITNKILKLLLKSHLKKTALKNLFLENSLQNTDFTSVYKTKNKIKKSKSFQAPESKSLNLFLKLNIQKNKKLNKEKSIVNRVDKLNLTQPKKNLFVSKNYSYLLNLLKKAYQTNYFEKTTLLKFDLVEKDLRINLKTKIFNLKKKNLQIHYFGSMAARLSLNISVFTLLSEARVLAVILADLKHLKQHQQKQALFGVEQNSCYVVFLQSKNNAKQKHNITQQELSLVLTLLKQQQNSLTKSTNTAIKDLKNQNLVSNDSSKFLSNSNFQKILEEKTLFNNIYSLSHTFNWKKEKDWRAFFFYTSGSPNYNDRPIYNYKNRISNSETPSLVGAGIIQKLLEEFNLEGLKKMDKQNRIQLYEFSQEMNELKKFIRLGLADKSDELRYREIFQERNKLIRRLKLTRVLSQKKSNPESMILSTLPVLPPDLRPIIKIEGQIAASDLNRFYQRILYRNERLKKFLKDPATRYSYEMKFTQRLLQESVDNLISNGKGKVAAEKDSRGRPLKSLSDILKGKEGRFRQHLLGKRVDYSGRSVIVVGPKLKIHECGLPKEMALELFLPFLLKRLIHSKMARTVIGAKTILQTNPILTVEILNEVMQNHPILLNRAPTLHRLGVQAFQAKLIEGRAILLHPLVCPAFNADFDGDQMAVHVPITVEARAETWKLMFSRGNLLSPATGDPILLPSQDMVLGCYYLTTESLKYHQLSNIYFSNIQQVMSAYYHQILPQKLHLHSIIWLNYPVASLFHHKKLLTINSDTYNSNKYRISSANDIFENDHDNEEPIEIRIEKNGYWKEISKKIQQRFDKNNILISRYIRTTIGRIIFNLIIQDCLK